MWNNKSPDLLLNVLMAIISSHWPRKSSRDSRDIIQHYTKQILLEEGNLPSITFLELPGLAFINIPARLGLKNSYSQIFSCVE